MICATTYKNISHDANHKFQPTFLLIVLPTGVLVFVTFPTDSMADCDRMWVFVSLMKSSPSDL